MKKSTKIAGAALAVTLGVLGLTACTSDADQVDQNIITEAEAFQVQRHIVALNGITGEVLFTAEGRCSFEYPAARRVDVICKYGPDEYRKHVFILGDQDQVIIAQEVPIDVSEYHTKIIIKPQNLIPEFGLSVGEDR